MVNNLIIIKAEIGDNTGNFIFDTGSESILVNESNQHNAHSSQTFQTVNGQASTESTNIEYLKIGNFTKTNLPAFITNLSNIEEFISMELSGIIGAEIFNPNGVYIDFVTSVIHIYENQYPTNIKEFNNDVAISMNLGVPTTMIQVGSETLYFILDTGASIHLIDESVKANYPAHFTITEENVSVETVGDTAEAAAKYKINDLVIGETSLKGHRCIVKDFTSINDGQETKISGLISISKLTTKGVLIDFKNMRLYF